MLKCFWGIKTLTNKKQGISIKWSRTQPQLLGVGELHSVFSVVGVCVHVCVATSIYKCIYTNVVYMYICKYDDD